jgi:cyclic pyranopterin phosphate synthase
MVDVGKKEESFRTAEAEGWVHLPPSVYEAVGRGRVKKGDV